MQEISWAVYVLLSVRLQVPVLDQRRAKSQRKTQRAGEQGFLSWIQTHSWEYIRGKIQGASCSTFNELKMIAEFLSSYRQEKCKESFSSVRMNEIDKTAEFIRYNRPLFLGTSRVSKEPDGLTFAHFCLSLRKAGR